MRNRDRGRVWVHRRKLLKTSRWAGGIRVWSFANRKGQRGQERELGMGGKLVVGCVVEPVERVKFGQQLRQGGGGFHAGLGAVAVDEDAGVAVLRADVGEGGAEGMVEQVRADGIFEEVWPRSSRAR